MTYGVYTKDLHGCSLSMTTLNNAKKYCHSGRVVCSEKEICFGWEWRIVFMWFFRDWRFRWKHRWDNTIYLGPFVISRSTLHYTSADKIVYDPQEEGGAK